MKFTYVFGAVILLGTASAGSYWLGQRAGTQAGTTAASPTATQPQPKVRKLLYYRNPMGLADTSPTPKKDPMGMDYVAVYEGEDDAPPASASGASNQVRINTDKVQKLGVRTEAASMRVLGKTVRAAGRIEPDERRVFVITPKFEGYVERLHVNATGQAVGKGQALFEVYSPDMVAAQREYVIAQQGVQAMQGANADAQTGMKQLAESSLVRLRNWGLSPTQITSLTTSGQAQRSITFYSPVSGVVTEKKAVQGMRFMPGEMLYQVTDLSSIWVIADLTEQDIGLVKLGTRAKIKVSSYPNEQFEGRISYVYPTLNTETRTVPVRVELSNPGMKLKPAMFAQVELGVGAMSPVLTVPESAVIDSGRRRIVLVQVNEGQFEPREVELGDRAEDYVEVIGGVKAGEQVVVAANFLIDAESNLKAAVGGFGGHAGHGGAAKGAKTPAPAPAAKPGAGVAIGHRAEGSVDSIDLKAGTLTLKHGPVPALKWPAMTMEFTVANAALLTGLKPGQNVNFEFVERQPGEFVVTSIAAVSRAVQAQTSTAQGAHSGH